MLRELRQKHASIVGQAKAILNKANATAEDLASFDAMMAEADTVEGQIRRLEQAATIEANLALRVEARTEGNGQSRAHNQADAEVMRGHERRMLAAYLTQSEAGLTPEDQATIRARMATPAAFQNAAGTGTATAGGYTVAPEFVAELIELQDVLDVVRNVASKIQTATGATLVQPTMDDTSQVATIVAENSPGVSAPDLVFGQKALYAWTWRSGFLPVSIELLQDSAINIDSLIQRMLANRFARGQGRLFTYGTGTGQPQGVVTGAGVGKTGVAGQTTSVVYDDLVDLQHAIPVPYRKNGQYMMHDLTLASLRKLKDGFGHPIWGPPDLRAGVPGTLLGAPYVINPDMPTMAAGARSILYGDFSTYVIRDVLGLRILRLNERFAENGQVAFLGFQRTDGRIISATNTIVAYVNSAT